MQKNELFVTVVFIEWSKESLLQSWIEDPIRCCEISGVNPPLSLLHERGLTTIDINEFDTVNLSKEVTNQLILKHENKIVFFLLLCSVESV